MIRHKFEMKYLGHEKREEWMQASDEARTPSAAVCSRCAQELVAQEPEPPKEAVTEAQRILEEGFWDILGASGKEFRHPQSGLDGLETKSHLVRHAFASSH